jgi:predicted metal-dependent HD superfamily phosphohydrolase
VTPSLEARYAEPHRRYHTRGHIEACLDLLAQWPEIPERERRLLTWAIWWHDAIYDPKASDNEARSAELARRELPHLGAGPDEVEEVARLVLLTAGHAVPEDDRLGAVLISIDLAILATPPPVYEAYARAIRAEYAHVPEDAWRAGRTAVLQRFLDASVIFPHPGFRDAHEAQARANLAREIEQLRS